ERRALRPDRHRHRGRRHGRPPPHHTAGHRVIRAVLALALAAFAAGACAPASAASFPTQIGIRIHYSHFSPDKIDVPIGVPVTFTLVNDDPIDHEWLLGDEAFHARHRLGTAAACESVDATGRTAGATPNGIRLTRPSALLMWAGDSPVLLRAVPEAGSFVLPYRGGWRYDGRQGTLVPAVSAAERIEHPSPTGTLTAIERQSLTPGGYAFSKELAVRDRPGGPERTIYRAPEMS